MIKKTWPFALLAFYILLLVKVMVLKDVPLIRIGHLLLNFGGTQYGTYNLIPFKTIGEYFAGNKGFLIASINISGNILLLVPLGFLFAVCIPNLNRLQIIALSIFSGLAIELMQVVLKVGIFDIDDVMLNALGAILGVFIFYSAKASRKYISLKYLYIGVTIIVLMIITFTGIYYAKQGRWPIAFGESAENRLKILPAHRQEPYIGPDPCRGSGGTGEIISLEKNAFIIRSSRGVNQKILLTQKTSFQSSTGELKQTDVKLGDRVTIVTGPDNDEGMTAALVLICNTK